jgi:glycosyltransferase involved in cell wall biosynthesis
VKILLFTDTLGDLNGVSRFIQDMGELASQSDRLELHVATSTSKPLPDAEYISNLPYKRKMPMPFYQELDLVWPDKKAIVKLLDEFEPDLVHISTPGPFGWAAKNLSEKRGIPLVGTYHTDFPAYIRDLTGLAFFKRLTDRIMAKFYRSFLHVFSRSEQYLEVMANDIAIDYERSSVISAGTNLQRFNCKHHDKSVWKKYGLSGKRAKVLYVGRINIEKNIPFLCEVWQELHQQFPGFKVDLVMIGEGRYRKWASKMRPYHAYFLGPVTGDKLSKIYASSDFFVFPSVTDTLGQVVMEAQASGMSCLVSDVGGPQTLVIEDQTGQVIQADDLEAWMRAIADELKKDRYKAQKNLCVEHMQQYNIQDSFEHFLATHEALYEHLKQD